MMTSRWWIATSLTLALALVASACGKGKDKDKDKEETGKAAASEPPAQPAPSAPSAPAPPPPAPTDPFANGFCEYTVDGGAPNKGGGGIMNVQSKHWIAEERGKKMASWLLINCGASKQINLGLASEDTDAAIPLAPGKFPIAKGNASGKVGVLGPDFMGGEGELDVTAFDKAHVAGTFEFTAGGKKYAGSFDLKCPQPGNGICP